MRVMRTVVIILVAFGLLLCAFLAGGVTTGLALGNGGSRLLAARFALQDSSAPTSVQERAKIFWEAWNVAHNNYVDEKALDDQKMMYGAIEGMLDSLGDQGHTRFMSPKEADAQAQSIQGSFSGIGAEVTRKDGRPVIVTPIEGSPAEKIGVKSGDVIMKVDGQDTADFTLDEVIGKIRGPEGTDVTVTLLRPSTGETIELKITRSKIKVKTVTSIMVPGTKVAHIRLNQYSANASDELRAAVADAKAQGATGIIFDLRNNPGGLLSEAVNVTSEFLKDGNVLLQRDRGGKETPYPVKKGGQATDIPMVVLINQGTASAAEITSGALQHYKRATVVGMPTFGTGTVLSTFKLSDGSALLLGTGEWLTPGGDMIRRQGIAPDVKVEMKPDVQIVTPTIEKTLSAQDIQSTQDLQFKKALELLSGGTASVELPASAAIIAPGQPF
ncbi:MAG: S41 family peptidase [Anaerolineae bacterium]